MSQPPHRVRVNPRWPWSASRLAFVAGVGNLPRAVPDPPRKPLWLYPNLLGLDAPLVAVAWLYVFAQSWRLGYHPWEAYASLGLAVWVIYAADRLLDASIMGEGNPNMEARHRFHFQHRKWFRLALMVAAPLLLALVVARMPMALYKYLVPGGVLVAGFFGLAMIHSQEPERVSLTKNIIGGTAFAFGTAIIAHVYRYEFDLYDMLLSREFVCFAVLCIMNISAIGLWEHASRAPDREIAAADELTLTLPLILLAGVSLAYAVTEEEVANRPFFHAILTGAGLLYVLNRSRTRLGTDALRVLADVAMLVPVLVYYASRQ